MCLVLSSNQVIIQRRSRLCVFCWQREEHDFFDPGFLKISLVTRQKWVIFNSPNILKWKCWTMEGYALSLFSGWWGNPRSFIPAMHFPLNHTAPGTARGGLSWVSTPVRFCVCWVLEGMYSLWTTTTNYTEKFGNSLTNPTQRWITLGTLLRSENWAGFSLYPAVSPCERITLKYTPEFICKPCWEHHLQENLFPRINCMRHQRKFP